MELLWSKGEDLQAKSFDVNFARLQRLSDILRGGEERATGARKQLSSWAALAGRARAKHTLARDTDFVRSD